MSAVAPPAGAVAPPPPSWRVSALARRVARVRPATAAGAAAIAVLACASVAYRWWQAAAGPPIVWTDSLDYARSAIWAGSRPPLVPIVLAMSPTYGWFVAIQTAVAALAWGALAWAVAARVPRSWRVVAVFAVLAFASTTAVVRWDRSVLSESLATSTLALLVAALLWASARPSWLRIAAVVGAAAAFAAARDTDIWIVWALAVVVAVDAVVARRGARGIVLALALAVCAGGLLGGVLSSGRTEPNIEHVYFVRVFPYPDRVAWFADHGMPDADIVLEYAADTQTRVGAAPVVGIDHADTRVPGLVTWLHDHGAATYARWLVEHPAFLVTEPLQRPERAYNFGDGSLDGYSGPERTELTALDAVVTPDAWTVLAVAVLALAVMVTRRSERHTSGARIAVAVAGLGLVHMLVAWHGDGMETTRHASGGNVQARLGVLLLAILAGAELVAGRRRPAPAPASADVTPG